MLYGKSGDEEYKRLNAWVTDLKDVPDIRRHLSEAASDAPFADFRDKAHKARNKVLKGQGQQELQAWKNVTVHGFLTDYNILR